MAALLFGAGLVVIGVVLLARLLDARSWRRSLTAIELRFPSGLGIDDVVRWLGTVAATLHTPAWSLLPHPPVVLEISATRSGIRYALLVPERLQGTIASGLRAALPGIRTEALPNYVAARPRLSIAGEAVLAGYRRQLTVDRGEATATAILASLQPLGPGQSVLVQWILTGAATPKPIPSRSGKTSGDLSWWVTDELSDGDAIRAARVKIADPLLSAVLRIGVQAATRAQAYALLLRTWIPHRGLNAPGVSISRRWWVTPRWGAARLARLVVPITGWPLLLGIREAAGLLPIPVGGAALPGVRLGAARQLPPPPGLPGHGVQLGTSNYPGLVVPLRLTPDDRLRHLHVVGPTGTGKSTLLANLITQDIAAGHAVVVIDPKGDLCGDVLDRVPEDRLPDVVLLDPSATDRPVGFNILQSAHDEQSRELVVDHVIHIWHGLYRDFWGPRTEDVLRGALLTLIHTKAANGSAFTLVEVPELLTDASFRRFVISQPGVPHGLDSFWDWYQAIKETDRLRVVGPVLNKLRAATLRTPIRLALGQSDGIQIDRLINQRKVLLVPLGKGGLGSGTASLLGTLLLATLWQAILTRAGMPASQRRPVFVHIDEAQDVLRLPVDLADMLAQARGLGAGFTLAHQHLGQIENKQVRSALLGTVRSQVVFQCQREDAVVLAKSYEPRLTAEDLMGLEAFEIATRLTVHGQTVAPTTGTTHPLPDPVRDGRLLAAASRERYGVPRTDVESALAQRKKPTASRTTDGPRFGRERRTTPDGGDL